MLGDQVSEVFQSWLFIENPTPGLKQSWASIGERLRRNLLIFSDQPSYQLLSDPFFPPIDSHCHHRNVSV